MGGPVGLPCLATSRGFSLGAACKARQWTGKAGSTAAAGSLSAVHQREKE